MSLGGRIGEAGEAAGNSRLVQEAVKQAQAGDSEGLHFLYVRYAPDVQRFVNSIVKRPPRGRGHHPERLRQADEVDQASYEQREVPFVAWILRVARNATLDHMRARRAIPTEEVRIADTGQAQVGIDRGRDLRHALEQLPEDQREVLVLRHIVGLSPVEIAATLSKSESSVHGLHHRGRRSLQAKLVEIGAAPVVAPPAA